MINEIRPKAKDFQPYVGESYRVVSSERLEGQGVWRLVEVSILEVPPVEILEEEDCFILIFEATEVHAQGEFMLEGPDGVKWRLVATPTYSGSDKCAMQVVIN